MIVDGVDHVAPDGGTVMRRIGVGWNGQGPAEHATRPNRGFWRKETTDRRISPEARVIVVNDRRTRYRDAGPEPRAQRPALADPSTPKKNFHLKPQPY